MPSGSLPNPSPSAIQAWRFIFELASTVDARRSQGQAIQDEDKEGKELAAIGGRDNRIKRKTRRIDGDG